MGKNNDLHFALMCEPFKLFEASVQVLVNYGNMKCCLNFTHKILAHFNLPLYYGTYVKFL